MGLPLAEPTPAICLPHDRWDRRGQRGQNVEAQSGLSPHSPSVDSQVGSRATLSSCLKDVQLIATADREGGAQTSSGEHFSEHRLLLLNKVSRGILKCKRDMHSVTQAQAAENTKSSPSSTPQVHKVSVEA